MRSYSQFCPVAKALDVIGERWNLLIIRELLLSERCRYTDIRRGLPGIATNLLTERLRDLERAGIVTREEAPPPIATTLYLLTERGLALKPILWELALWGAPLLQEASAQDTERTHWLVLLADIHLTDNEPDQLALGIQIDLPGELMILETLDGAVRARAGRLPEPDLSLAGDFKILAALLAGQMTLAEARKRGLKATGRLDALRRISPPARSRASLSS